MSVQNLPLELTDAPQWVADVFHNLPPLASFYDVAPLVGMSRGSLSNMLSEGRGPDGGMIVGRKRVFPRLSVVQWLMSTAATKEAKAVVRKGRAA